MAHGVSIIIMRTDVDQLLNVDRKQIIYGDLIDCRYDIVTNSFH